MGRGIAAAREVNGAEDTVGHAVVKNGKLIFDIKKYEPKTFAITLLQPSKKVNAPPFAVDGNINTKWCQVSSSDMWLTVDLGQEYTINRWIVRHAGAGGESTTWNTKDFKLQKSDDGSNWEDADVVSGNTDNVTNREVDPFTSRYVRLYITKPTNTSDRAARIYELELYAPESSDNAIPILGWDLLFQLCFEKAS